MEDFLKSITNYDSITQIYHNNLFTLKSISQYLGEWDLLSNDEKCNLENYTTADSLLNGNINEYYSKLERFESENLGYGEITKSGTEAIYKYIKKNIKLTSEDIFYDIGSGHGKMIIHLSLISNFKKYVGIEIDRLRYKYSLNILSQIGEVDNIEFLNIDVLQHDLSDASIVFMNDTLFSKDLIYGIFSKLKRGTHVISLEENKYKPVGTLELDVTWLPIPLEFRHYIV